MQLPIQNIDSRAPLLKTDSANTYCRDWSLLTVPLDQLRSKDLGYADSLLTIEVAGDSMPNAQINYEFKVKRERRSVFPT